MDNEYPAHAEDLDLIKADARFQVETVQGKRKLIYSFTRAELDEMLDHYVETDEQIIRIQPESYIENVT